MDTFLFALARFNHFQSQNGEVIRFNDAGIEILKKGKAIHSFPYCEIVQLEFMGMEKIVPDFVSLLAERLFRKEEQFVITTEKETSVWLLEMDSSYRKLELSALFRGLYEKDLLFIEKTNRGHFCFLFEKMDRESLEKKIQDFRVKHL